MPLIIIDAEALVGYLDDSTAGARIVDRAKALVVERSFAAAIAGILALAVVVNMIELLCSAGTPAAYTQVLAPSDLSAAAYCAYLLLFVAVFMLDDVAIFAAAMLTLRAAGMATTYARWSHLVGAAATCREQTTPLIQVMVANASRGQSSCDADPHADRGRFMP